MALVRWSSDHRQHGAPSRESQGEGGHDSLLPVAARREIRNPTTAKDGGEFPHSDLDDSFPFGELTIDGAWCEDVRKGAGQNRLTKPGRS